jgi:hypothetical protein
MNKPIFGPRIHNALKYLQVIYDGIALTINTFMWTVVDATFFAVIAIYIIAIGMAVISAGGPAYILAHLVFQGVSKFGLSYDMAWKAVQSTVLISSIFITWTAMVFKYVYTQLDDDDSEELEEEDDETPQPAKSE